MPFIRKGQLSPRRGLTRSKAKMGTPSTRPLLKNGEIRKIENVEKYINGIYRNKRKTGLRRESIKKGIIVSSDSKTDDDDNGIDFADMETEKEIRNKRFLKSCLNAVRSEKLERFFVLRYVVWLDLG